MVRTLSNAGGAFGINHELNGGTGMRYVAWVEGEWIGEFGEIEEALAEAAATAFQRDAEVIVEDSTTRSELTVRIDRRDEAHGEHQP